MLRSQIGQTGQSFNPSVGILWGGTRPSRKSGDSSRRFQSLGRDSVGWDDLRGAQAGLIEPVSIPRSGFCGVGPKMYTNFRAGGLRFQSLGRDSVGWDLAEELRTFHNDHGFNPSVGILWGGTRAARRADGRLRRFQSLGRDSVGWDGRLHR